jgi:hypothetical protein
MMFTTQLLLISLALAPLTYAQDAQLPIPCCNISPSDVSESDRNSWCKANQNSCVEACGGQGQIRSDGNTCNTVYIHLKLTVVSTLIHRPRRHSHTSADATRASSPTSVRTRKLYLDSAANSGSASVKQSQKPTPKEPRVPLLATRLAERKQSRLVLRRNQLSPRGRPLSPCCLQARQ